MKLAQLKVSDFTDLLASLEPAPGGGSTAALEGALGAELTAMVAAFTLGRKKYAEYEELALYLIHISITTVSPAAVIFPPPTAPFCRAFR